MPFEAEGWTSAGYFIRGKHRYRMWIPAPDSTSDDANDEWGVVISDKVSPTRALEILRLMPTRRFRHRRRA